MGDLTFDRVSILMTQSQGISTSLKASSLRLRLDHHARQVRASEVAGDLPGRSSVAVDDSPDLTLLPTPSSQGSAFARRKASLLLPNYASNYVTLQLDRVDALLTGEALDADLPARLELFASIVRCRFLVTSCWLHLDGKGDTFAPKCLAALLSGAGVSVDRTSPSLVAKLAGEWSNVDEFILRGAQHVLDAPLLDFVSSQPELLEATPQYDRRFFGVVAYVSEPSPAGFGKARDLTTCAETVDWHCMAAGVLPVVVGDVHDYHTSYLHSLLGEDLMDSSGGHYFVTRRTVMALTRRQSPDTAAVVQGENLTTWTQLLCENAAMQLGMIRDHTAQIDEALQQRAPAATSVDTLARQQRAAQQDLDEHYNVALGRVDIYWEHLQAIKRVNGLDFLHDGLADKLASLFQLASFNEERALTRGSFTLSVIFGAFGVASVTEAALIHADTSVLWVITGTAISAVVGMVLGTLLGCVFRRRLP